MASILTSLALGCLFGLVVAVVAVGLTLLLFALPGDDNECCD